MEKDGSGEGETCITPIVSKDVEITQVGRSLSKNEILSHHSGLENTDFVTRWT